MENTKNLHDMEDFDFDDDEDALSLCDLPLSHQETESNTSLYEQQRSDSHPDFFFEFSTSPCSSDTDCPTPDSLSDLPLSHQETESNTSLYEQQGSDSLPDFFFEFSTSPCSLDTDCPTPDNIIFCGKILSCKNEEPTNNNYDNKPVSSAGSLKKNKISSNSSSKSSSPPWTAQSLIRSLSSGNSRKQRKFLIGLAKIPTKMELSDIRERQKRQAPPPMFPEVVADETPVVNGSSRSKSRELGLRPLSCSAHLRSGLPKASFVCFPLARPALSID